MVIHADSLTIAMGGGYRVQVHRFKKDELHRWSLIAAGLLAWGCPRRDSCPLHSEGLLQFP
jgi:hypothetical protein